MKYENIIVECCEFLDEEYSKYDDPINSLVSIFNEGIIELNVINKKNVNKEYKKAVYKNNKHMSRKDIKKMFDFNSEAKLGFVEPRETNDGIKYVIYITEDFAKKDEIYDHIAHELTHIYQMYNLGLEDFYNFYAEFDKKFSYFTNPLEEQAYKYGELCYEYFTKKKGREKQL